MIVKAKLYFSRFKLSLSSSIANNVRVFAKAGNTLIVQPGKNAQLKIYFQSYELKLKIERRARTAADVCK